jgi:hypothetical protein
LLPCSLLLAKAKAKYVEVEGERAGEAVLKNQVGDGPDTIF